MFTKVEERIIECYVVLILANRRTIEQAKESLREEIELRIAERTIDLLE